MAADRILHVLGLSALEGEQPEPMEEAAEAEVPDDQSHNGATASEAAAADWELLGVARQASFLEVRRVYRNKRGAWLQNRSPAADAEFQRLAAAYRRWRRNG